MIVSSAVLRKTKHNLTLTETRGVYNFYKYTFSICLCVYCLYIIVRCGSVTLPLNETEDPEVLTTVLHLYPPGCSGEAANGSPPTRGRLLVHN